MNIILFLFFLIYPVRAKELSRIVVLISVQNPIHRPLFTPKNWSFSRDLKKYFQKKIDLPEYELVFFENANQEMLFTELSNPDNLALFWISHAISFENSESGLSLDDTILDVEGNNVRDIFQKVHPNLKYLSILGCKAGPIIKNLKESGFYTNNPHLEIYAKDSKIIAKKEIKKSIKDFKNKLKTISKNTPSCFSEKGIPIQISRKIPLTLRDDFKRSSIKIFNRGKLLGLFPKAELGDQQSLTVYLPNDKIKSPTDLKIIFDTGNTDKTKKLLIGDFEISTNHLNGLWQPFKSPNGEILGITRHIYRFQGNIDLVLPEISFNPFYCDDFLQSEE